MDKFGIFKLLNSFLSLYSQTGKKSGDDSVTNVNSQSPDFTNGIAKLFGGETKPAPPPEKQVVPPLQANMISTMRAHDDFVKRVKQGVK